ncbi:ubiquitin receptor RAD23c-like [Hibiscus syriacus]|uniref:Ubiquitin receptor RAD23c-like n=1 Tax=Hibiscus syriacus TaxID=106335 RepID=A0A6A2YIN0_HIBSY|nr:ubiquitin receptor RAD23c-like [Hibiscus syriacus]
MENKDSIGASENGEDQLSKTLADNNKGGIKALPFIIAPYAISKSSQHCDQLQWHLELDATVGAFFADSYAGKFWTITVATAIYLTGMIVLTLSAAMPQLRPPPCEGNQVCQEANGIQTAILYLALLLAALGSGGIRPCVAAFGVEQFVEEDPRHPKKTWVFFNWYYFALGAAILIASTVLVYIQDHVGWSLGIGIPTIAMALSIIVFLIGYPLYRNLDPAGSPYTCVLQVCVSAYRKRKIPLVSDPKLLFLDKAAIVTEEDAGILFATSNAQENTFSVQQTNTMDKQLTKSFEIPSTSMSVFASTSMLIMIILYDHVLVHVARRSTGLDRGINFLQRMAIGFFISILATLVAGLVEYSLYGIAEAFMVIGQLEFFYNQAPESTLFWTSISAGDYTSTLLVTLVHKYTDWLPIKNLNKGKLEYYYWLLTALQTLNFVYYLICAKFYTFKALNGHKIEYDERVELTSQV